MSTHTQDQLISMRYSNEIAPLPTQDRGVRVSVGEADTLYNKNLKTSFWSKGDSRSASQRFYERNGFNEMTVLYNYFSNFTL